MHDIKDKVVELLKQYPAEDAERIVTEYASDAIEYASEWTNDLFYRGVQFAAKYGTDYEVITFVDNKLHSGTSSPLESELEDTKDYIVTDDNIDRMFSFLSNSNKGE